jgi:hypothetical protein
MTALAHRIESTLHACVAVESSNLADLARIYEPEFNLCLIHRQPEAPLSAFVTECLRRSDEIELAAEVRFERFDFASLLPGREDIFGYDAWWRDVARLAAAFCDLFEIERVGLRLRTLDRPMCPRFHVDHVSCRLVCTYGGIGTEWLPDECVDRAKLGPGAKGLPDEESGLMVDASAIRTMPAYAVGLMKGAKWEGNNEHGAVHRSPKLTPQQPRRLLLTLDML